ncbi:MFS transporter [Ammoniphilus resinae]|uniref:MFS family permease n=1 Tax=Ammoniphilus resinae TaxID=861532 RepID=A0ABS4GPC9_9BACL|nr:MFS transporter [Ammoniphilus resinae]MBP1932128.1 MFS family permease [Ammoniphilus resinae]
MIFIIINMISIGFQTMIYMTRPIISLYASDLGAGTLNIGLLTAAYSFLPLFLAIHAGKVADRIGDRLPVLFGSLGLFIGLAFPFLFASLWALYLSQAIIGISYIFVNISLQNVLGHATTPQTRDHHFGIFSMMVAVAGVIGPVIGGYISEHFSHQAVFMVAIILGLLPLLVAFRLPNSPRQKVVAGGKSEQAAGSGSSPFTLLKLPLLRSALISSALVLYSRDIFIAYFPLYASQMGVSTSAIGWILAVQGMAMVAVRFFLGRITESFDRNQILLTSILIAGVSFLVFPVTNQVFLFGVLSALMGAGLGCGQPLSMTTTYNASPASRTGEVLGLRLATNRLSQFIAPMFFGLIGSWVGLVSIFYLSGSFLIGGAFLSRTKPQKND